MNDSLYTLIPRQKSGKSTGTCSRQRCKNTNSADALFKSAVSRLFDINSWHSICGNKGAKFHLCDESGHLLNAPKPEEGNLIRIQLNAPPNPDGGNYDWVRIEYILEKYDDEEPTAGFRVRPVKNPLKNSLESAHFYTDEATSSFYVTRRGLNVYASEQGRNEHSNTGSSVLAKMRNALVAFGAKMGLSFPQWKRLTRALLKPKNK